MDTRKLLKIISDIQSDESSFAIQNKLQDLINYHRDQNDNAVTTTITEINNNIESSLLMNATPTDMKAMEEIGINNYFGINLSKELNNIFHKPFHEIGVELEALVQRRQDYLSRFETIRSSLSSFKLEPRSLKPDEYELGFAFPESYSDLDKLNKVLKDIRAFMAELASSQGEKVPLKITAVDNGCIEVFIHTGAILAHKFSIVLGHIVNIYTAYKAYQDFKEMAKNYGKDRKELVEKAGEEERDDQIDQILDNLVTALEIESPEHQTKVKQSLKLIIPHLEKGVIAEVRTPNLPEPAKPAEDSSDEAKKNFKKEKHNFELKSQIDNNNKQFVALQQYNFYGVTTNLLENKIDSTQDNSNKK